MPSPYASLQRTEALARRELLDLTSYDVALDLAADDATFGSVTTLRFSSRAGATFLDLKPVSLAALSLDGRPLDVDLLERGRFPLELTEGEHELVVEATMPFRNDGEGLHRSVDPADGKHYVYGMSFMDAAPTIFACFDQPDLKAPYTFHVRAPQDWVVIGNAPGRQVEKGVWEFEQSQPLSTYFVTLVAGPYHVIRDEHDGIPLGLSARASIAADLDKDAEELFTLTKQSFDELHRLFGIRYPFGDYHQAFVPEFNAGAMENPGCVTFRDPLIFTSRVTRGVRIARASTLAHEMAHQWFGNLVTPAWWDDLWLNESFAEYMGNRVTADVTEYADAWVDNSYARRQWGLVADQRPSTHPVAGNGAVDASAALQDFDGISYAKGCAILRQLNATLGDEVFFKGTIDHFEQPPLRQRHDARPLRELGAGRSRRPVELHRQLAAHRRPGPDRARPRGRRRPPYAARGPSGRPAAPHPRGRRDRGRHLDRPRAGDRGPGDAVRRRRPAGAARPLQRHLGAADPGQADHGRARAACSPASRTPSSAPGSGATSAARCTTPPSTRSTCSRSRSRSLPVEDTEDSRRRTMAWVYGWVVPLQPDPEAALAQLHAAAARQARRRRADLGGAAGGVPGRDRAPASDLGRAARLAGRRPAARGRPPRPRPALAGAGPAGHAGRGRPRRAGPSARGRAHRGGPGPARRRARLAARRRGEGLGLVAASPARPTCPTTSSRRSASGFWRGGQEELTDAVRRALLRRPARHRQACAAAGCWRTPPSTSSRAPP